jgi:hypothetical protein
MERKKFLRLSLLAPLSAVARPLHFLSDTAGKPRWEGCSLAYIKPGDPGYDLLRRGFNRRINRLPALVASCRNTQEVAEAVAYSIKNRLPVAVKSGGHCMEGFSVNDGGMSVNLSTMNKLEWLNDSTIRVEPGCTLARLYAELLPKNKIIPGGSCAGVAIGGLTLGGGYGLLSRKYGLTCDSLQSITMVDGTGRIVTAAGNDELIWACRGGNNGNFGIITEMVFQVHPAPRTLQSHRFRAFRADAARAETILQHWFRLCGELPPECFSAFVLNGHTVYILLTNAGKSGAAVQAVIRELRSITDKTTATAPLPLSRALQAYYGRPHPLYFKNASAGLYKSYAEIASCIPAALEKVISTPGMIYQVNTLGGNIRRSAFAQGSAFPHRECLYFSELQTYWEQPSQEKRLLERFEQVQDIFRQGGIRAQYRNYPDIRLPGWETAYYGEQYAKLQRIKSIYDPHNLFRYEQSIRPA